MTNIKVTPIGQALIRAEAVLREAIREHPEPFHSNHEGFAVLLEEVDELKAEVWQRQPNSYRLRAEAADVAAVALRFMVELTPSLADENPLSKAHALVEMVKARLTADEMERSL